MLMPIEHKQTVEEVEEASKLEIADGPHPTAGMDFIQQRPVTKSQTKGKAITGALPDQPGAKTARLCWRPSASITAFNFASLRKFPPKGLLYSAKAQNLG